MYLSTDKTNRIEIIILKKINSQLISISKLIIFIHLVIQTHFLIATSCTRECLSLDNIQASISCTIGGTPSTWFPPRGLVEQSSLQKYDFKWIIELFEMFYEHFLWGPYRIINWNSHFIWQLSDMSSYYLHNYVTGDTPLWQGGGGAKHSLFEAQLIFVVKDGWGPCSCIIWGHIQSCGPWVIWAWSRLGPRPLGSELVCAQRAFRFRSGCGPELHGCLASRVNQTEAIQWKHNKNGVNQHRLEERHLQSYRSWTLPRLGKPGDHGWGNQGERLFSNDLFRNPR